MKAITLILFFALILSSQAPCQTVLLDSHSQPAQNFFQLESNAKNNISIEMSRKKGFKPLNRYVQLMKSRVDSNGFIPNAREILSAYQDFSKNKNPHIQSTGVWQEVGPRSPQLGQNKQLSGSGRINCIEFSKADSNLIWAGSASGGLWKSNDRGNSWEVIDFTEFLSMGVSDIAVSSSDPNTLYVATGDADGSSFLGCYSLGIIKSTDCGITWKVLDLGIKYENGEFISKILLNPRNEKILYAATSKSIMKSTDAGEQWQTLLSGFNFRDLKFKPDNPDILYASTYSISDGSYVFYTDDAGEQWFILKYFPDASRTKLAVTPLSPDRLLALCVDKISNSFGGLYLSDSQGFAWQTLANDTLDYSYLVQAQGFFNLLLEFSPFSKDDFFIGGVWLYKGNVKSNTFAPIADKVHVDMHNIKYNPNDSLMYLANDGGIYRFDANFNNIENISNNLGVTQFYRIGLNPSNPEIIYGGSQDNNIFEYFYDNWQFFWSGDGMETFVDPRDPSLVYYSTQRGSLYNTKHGLFNVGEGEQHPWVTAFLYQPLNPDVIYCGFENVWRSSNQGENFEKISDFKDKLEITSIALSRKDTAIIYASNAKKIYKTTNSGNVWENIFQSNDYISSIKTDQYGNLWVSIGQFNSKSKVYKISGDSIINQTYNLPNVPINCIEIDTTANKIYIGTDIGVFEKDFDANSWSKMGLNFPAVIVNELELHYGTGTLFAATFGRGLWSYKLFDCPIKKPTLEPLPKRYFCSGELVALKVAEPVEDYEYLWNDGTKGSEKIISDKGVYYVTARNSSNCVAASDTIFVWKPAAANIDLVLISPNPICEGDTARLLANLTIMQSVKRFGWSDGQKSTHGKFTQTGRYFFYVEDEYGCIYSSDTVSIFVNPVPAKPLIRKEGNWLYASNGDFFSWYLDDELIEEFEGDSCYIHKPGKYEVLIRDSNFCSNYSEAYIIEFNDLLKNNLQLSVSPNPSNAIFNLELNLTQKSDVSIIIYNAVGQIIYEKILSDAEGYCSELIDISSEPQSLYYLVAKTQFGVKNKILVKVK